jgi:hypothetical protein
MKHCINHPPGAQRYRTIAPGPGLFKPFTLLAALLLGLLANPLQGQQITIDWHKIAGGGGTSGDTHVSLSGTLGQYDASPPMTGGHFALTGGFWLPDVIFCSCSLSVTVTGGNVVVAWPCGMNGCILEATDELRSPQSATVWQPVSPQPADGIYTAPLTGNQRFFRLRAP